MAYTLPPRPPSPPSGPPIGMYFSRRNEATPFPPSEYDTWGVPEHMASNPTIGTRNPAAPPLATFLEGMEEIIRRILGGDGRLTLLGYQKVIFDCNWKVAQEAFMESYHVIATHPQILPIFADVTAPFWMALVSTALSANSLAPTALAAICVAVIVSLTSFAPVIDAF